MLWGCTGTDKNNAEIIHLICLASGAERNLQTVEQGRLLVCPPIDRCCTHSHAHLWCVYHWVRMPPSAKKKLHSGERRSGGPAICALYLFACTLATMGGVCVCNIVSPSLCSRCVSALWLQFKCSRAHAPVDYCACIYLSKCGTHKGGQTETAKRGGGGAKWMFARLCAVTIVKFGACVYVHMNVNCIHCICVYKNGRLSSTQRGYDLSASKDQEWSRFWLWRNAEIAECNVQKFHTITKRTMY